MISGSCNCGAVTFEIATDPEDIYMCHCSVCRRWTGQSGVAVLIVANENFKWRTGEDKINVWRKPDADWLSCFCRVCGSALPGPNDEDRMFVPAGLIEDRNPRRRVKAHIFVGSKAEWDEIGDDGQQFIGPFGD